MWLFWVKGQGFRPWDACQKMLVYFDFDENEIVKVDSKTNFPAKSYSVFLIQFADSSELNVK